MVWSEPSVSYVNMMRKGERNNLENARRPRNTYIMEEMRRQIRIAVARCSVQPHENHVGTASYTNSVGLEPQIYSIRLHNSSGARSHAPSHHTFEIRN
jgi:hypothetical protein